MQLTGFIEVFVNDRGYYVGRIVNNNKLKDNSTVLAKAFIDVVFYKDVPEEMMPKAGETVSLNVTEGFLSAKYIDLAEKPFSKLAVYIKKCELQGVYPKREVEVENVKKVRKTKKAE